MYCQGVDREMSREVGSDEKAMAECGVGTLWMAEVREDE